MSRTLTVALVALAVVALAGAGPAWAEPRDEGRKMEMVFEVAKKLLAKGDEAVVAMGRVLKAETYLNKLKKPELALKELELLESETTDKELLFAAATLRMIVLKHAEKDPEQLLAAVDKVIVGAKERMGRK